MKIAHGIFGWDGFERRSNRYGAIHLANSPYEGSDRAEVFHDKPAIKKLLGRRVRITCKVIESRKSGHIGDLFLKIKPSQPAVGEEIDLGVGILDMTDGYDGLPDLLLKPGDDREELWLDPHKLYRLHDQTVEVYVEETTDDFTPVAVIASSGDGAIDNGDGTFQAKTKAEAVRVKPQLERLGDGMFALHPIGSRGAGSRFEVEESKPKNAWDVIKRNSVKRGP